MSLKLIFRQKAASLVLYGISLTTIIHGVDKKKCLRTTCLQYFHWEGSKCPHNFSFCERCNEMFYCEDLNYDHCPRHPKSKSAALTPTSEERLNKVDEELLYDYIQTNLTATKLFDKDDFFCDEICNYAFDTLKTYCCRHGMVKCDNCNNIWDGNAQCLCFME